MKGMFKALALYWVTDCAITLGNETVKKGKKYLKDDPSPECKIGVAIGCSILIGEVAWVFHKLMK